MHNINETVIWYKSSASQKVKVVVFCEAGERNYFNTISLETYREGWIFKITCNDINDLNAEKSQPML